MTIHSRNKRCGVSSKVRKSEQARDKQDQYFPKQCKESIYKNEIAGTSGKREHLNYIARH